MEIRKSIPPFVCITLLTAIFIFILQGCQVETDSAETGDSEADGTEVFVSTLKTDVDNEKIISELNELIPKLMEKGRIPGLSIAVIKDGAIIWNESFGLRNAANDSPNTDDTVFQAASLSKPVFAYAVLKLADEGKIDLDKPLIEYAPEEHIEQNFLRKEMADDRFREITARMVMSHTTGLPNWRNRGNPLSFIRDPGESFGYSGEGFVFLQTVVEKITGTKCNDFVNTYVFEPLGMADSSYIWRKEYVDRVAANHNQAGKTAGIPMASQANAAAGLLTTAPDYAKFLIALVNGDGLKEDTYSDLIESHSRPLGEANEGITWGLGIGLQHTEDGQAFWHWGDNHFAKAFAIAFKEQKIGVVYFANSFYGLSIVDDIVHSAIGGEHPVLNSGFLSDYPRHDSAGMELINTYHSAGIDAFVKLYRKIKDDPETADEITESSINSSGYTLLGMKKYDDAITVFKLNVEAHPDSWNVYDSLGEAYMLNGQTETAIANYKKSLELNPDNENAKQKIKEMEERK